MSTNETNGKIILYARLPEWSKGVHLRCTVFALVGSNPTSSIEDYDAPLRNN